MLEGKERKTMVYSHWFNVTNMLIIDRLSCMQIFQTILATLTSKPDGISVVQIYRSSRKDHGSC